MQVDAGTGIYSVQQHMLGHNNVETNYIYENMADERMPETVNRITLKVMQWKKAFHKYV